MISKVAAENNRINLLEIKKYQNIAKRDGITLLGRYEDIQHYIIPMRLFLPSRLPIRVISERDFSAEAVANCRRWNIDITVCKTSAEWYRQLAESRFVIISGTRPRHGNEAQYDEQWVVFLAMTGAIILGGKITDGMHRYYPEITSTSLRNCWSDLSSQKIRPVGSSRDKVYCLDKWLETIIHCGYAAAWYHKLKGNTPKIEYLTEYANVKAEYSYWPNSITEHIGHICGPETVNYHHEEFVVVCLVKNGADYIRSLMDHYNRLGARHFFFIDNGSTDETVALLMQYPNVTLYQTVLPHKKYECEIRRAIIEKHCQNNWCLCVDIDELFDYPYSNQVSMRDFLRYLNTHHYTAVLSYLLDMFSRELVFSGEQPNIDIVGQYCYYDLSNIHKQPYHKSFFAFTRDNRLADPGMKSYSGGIRARVFKNRESGYLLTKHPLIFVDAHLESMVHPHFCNKALIADVNGVLKHYKFIASFKNKVVSSLESRDYNYYGEQEHKEYFNIIKDKDRLRLNSRKSKELKNIDQLVQQDFLKVSNMYRTYVKSIVSRK